MKVQKSGKFFELYGYTEGIRWRVRLLREEMCSAMDRKFRRKKWDLAAVKGAREHLEEIQDLLSRTEKIIAAEEARLANLPDEEDDEDDTYKFHELLIK